MWHDLPSPFFYTDLQASTYLKSKMDLLSQRIELQGFAKSYDPEGDGDCFYKAAAFQLGRDETDLKNEIFDFLAQNQYDVSVIYCH